MAEAFIGEIRPFGFNFAPRGWALCQGQIISISQNTALFSLLGTTFGGNGQTTFALPNLAGRTAVGAGNGPGLSPRSLGEMAGRASVTLTVTEVPSHTHGIQHTGAAGSSNSPVNAIPAVPARPGFASHAAVSFADGSVRPEGAGQAHNNYMPSISINYCIALEGIYPQRS